MNKNIWDFVMGGIRTFFSNVFFIVLSICRNSRELIINFILGANNQSDYCTITAEVWLQTVCRLLHVLTDAHIQ